MTLKYPLASSSWGEEEIVALEKVIGSGNFSMGPITLEFEKAFSDYIGSKYSVMVNSGSSANLLMIASLFFSKNDLYKLNPGDEVIVPALGWSTSYFPLQQYNLKLKFVDIDINTLNYDLNELESAISINTRAILAINILGNPNDFEIIKKLTNGRDILLLEDNCESLGAKIGQKMAGTFGIMGTFSTFFSHHMSTMEGGIITTNDEELYQIMLSLRAHGWTRNLPNKNHISYKEDGNDFDESFKFVLPGYNLRPIELSAAVGLEQLKKLPTFIEKRRDNGIRFNEALKTCKNVYIQKEIGCSSWFGFSIIIKESAIFDRNVILQKLNNAGFETRPIVSGNFVKNEVIKFFDYTKHGKLKNAEYLDVNGLFIGNHHYNLNDDFFSSLRLILE
jgi:CDP-4-dehydro-6-deoxyglucose reductase, E1